MKLRAWAFVLAVCMHMSPYSKEIDMKKLVNVSVLFGIAALVLLLAVGTAGAAPPQQMGRPGGGGGKMPGGWGGKMPRAGGGTWVQGNVEEEPTGTALRINFEVGGHKAHHGLYVVRYPGGDELASWSAYGGATDSGWINVEITRKTVWVEVVYYPGPNTAPTVMRILNPAPGTAYGWVSQGMSHAIEVAWPDMPVKADKSMPVMPDGNPWPTYGMTARPPYAMAQGPNGMPGGPGGMPGRPGGMPGRPGGMPGKPGG